MFNFFHFKFSDETKNHDTKPNQQERHCITDHKNTEQHQIIQEHMTNNTHKHSKISKPGSRNTTKESRTHATTHNKEQDHRTTSRTRATSKRRGQTRIQNTNNNKEETEIQHLSTHQIKIYQFEQHTNQDATNTLEDETSQMNAEK